MYLEDGRVWGRLIGTTEFVCAETLDIAQEDVHGYSFLFLFIVVIEC